MIPAFARKKLNCPWCNFTMVVDMRDYTRPTPEEQLFEGSQLWEICPACEKECTVYADVVFKVKKWEE